MATAELLELARKADVDAFEARCLELLETGNVALAALVAPFEVLQKANQPARVATLSQMVLENTAATGDPAAALAIARAALLAAPDNASLRTAAADLFRRVHGQRPGFPQIFEASGLAGGRPINAALRVLDLCLDLKAGDALLNRMDDHVAEVVAVDPESGLFTLRSGGRRTTTPASELAREFERVDPDDFRVLRQLRPERLVELIDQEPQRVVVGLIRAHGDLIDADVLKHELVPRYVEAKNWSKWWARVRTTLKSHKNVVIEGRAPIILRFVRQVASLEQQALAALAATNDPAEWADTIDAYRRDCAQQKQTPDAGVLAKALALFEKAIESARVRRPVEALATALILERLTEKCGADSAAARTTLLEMLRAAADPAGLISGLGQDAHWERGLTLLTEARPGEIGGVALKLLPSARAGALDQLVELAARSGSLAAVQALIDRAIEDPVHHPEVVYWLWKGPKPAAGLNAPKPGALFTAIMDALAALLRRGSTPVDVAKAFRQRVKAAFGLKDYALVSECIAQLDPSAAVTMRRVIERLDGLGDNVPARLLDVLRRTHPQVFVVQQKQVERWADPNVIWCTHAGLKRKTDERDHLVNVTMRDNARRIGEAASHGDLSENSEYKFALEERDLLRARLAKMNQELSLARTIEPGEVPTDRVGVGSRVTIRQALDSSVRTMTFLGPFETNVDQGILNYLAPLVQRLMGHRTGERLTLQLDGQESEYEILEITNGLAG